MKRVLKEAHVVGQLRFLDGLLSMSARLYADLSRVAEGSVTVLFLAQAYGLDLSFRILFMVIIGGLGSVMGSFLGAAFIVLLPTVLNVLAHALGISTAVASNLELMVFGSLIIFFLIVDPHGLARLWQIAKEKLRLWPFPH